MGRALQDGLYTSRDGGRTWSLRLPESIGAVAVDAAGRIFAAGFRRVYRSDDGGASWRPFTAGLPYDMNSFAFAPDRADVVYAGSDSGVFEVESVDPCRADCGGDGSVGIDDLIAAVAAASGDVDAGTCAVADRDANGRIEIAEIIAAVRDAQRPCANIPEPAYRAPHSVSLPTLPIALFADDVDRDGLVDALTVSEREVTLWRGDGAGGFALGNVASVDDVILGARAADLDGDGALDLVLTTSADTGASTHVRVLLNDGTGALQERAAYSVESAYGWSAIAIGDVNGDGALDLVVGDGAASIIVRQGTGDGAFGAARTIDIPGCDGEDLYCPVAAAVDLNHDGFADVVTARTVLLGSGDGTFAAVAGGASGAFADLDGDGSLDSFDRSWPDGAFDVRLGSGDGIFAGGYAFASGGYCEALASADLNADGASDIVCAIAPNWGDGSGESANRLTIALNLGDGAFALPRALPAPEAPLAVAVADVNGDGRLDLLAAGQCAPNIRTSCDGTAALSVWLAAP